MSDINKKNASNQMRTLISRMRRGYIANESVAEKKDLNMRDMLKITRKLNEVAENNPENKITPFDQKNEEDKLLNNFDDMDINIRFIPLEVYDDFIFWGGTVDGIIQFTYKVTQNENSSNVEFNYLEDFTEDNPDNMEIVDRLKSYYPIFAKYWQENLIQR